MNSISFKQKLFRTGVVFTNVIKSQVLSIKFYISIVLVLLPTISTFISLSDNIEIIKSYSQLDKDLAIFWSGFLSYSLRFLPIFSVVLSCNIVSEYFEKRTASITFTLPMSRLKILLVTVVTYEVIFILAALVNLTLFQIIDIIVLNHVIPSNGVFYALLFQLVIMNVWFSISYFLSSITQRTIIALSVPIVYMFVELLIPSSGGLTFLSITQTTASLLENITSLNTGEVFSISKIILPILSFTIFSVAIIGGSMFLFTRQDIRPE